MPSDRCLYFSELKRCRSSWTMTSSMHCARPFAPRLISPVSSAPVCKLYCHRGIISSKADRRGPTGSGAIARRIPTLLVNSHDPEPLPHQSRFSPSIFKPPSSHSETTSGTELNSRLRIDLLPISSVTITATQNTSSSASSVLRNSRPSTILQCQRIFLPSFTFRFPKPDLCPQKRPLQIPLPSTSSNPEKTH
ncbi:hypothetical protein BJ508DRAFT_19815 [Ascobolus immersus RN42]|uniref:Uncharacterized protein n=1 Tax=Ascobolus immersus RN42 TaxID=1160509 RepID=A0A3N4ITE7_ASCIM|nr:hypothetical protein BJ508DRAFT_19815 [Ascobolus immersus RN42]